MPPGAGWRISLGRITSAALLVLLLAASSAFAQAGVVAGGGGGGSGGGATTIADGADVAEGALADAGTSGAGTVNAHLRFIAATGIPITGNVTVVQGTATSLKAEIIGTKANNTAAPGSLLVGTAPCVANAAVQTVTETFSTTLSCDLSQRVRVLADINNGSATTTEAEGIATGAASVAETISFTNVYNPLSAKFTRLAQGQTYNATALPVSTARDDLLLYALLDVKNAILSLKAGLSPAGFRVSNALVSSMVTGYYGQTPDPCAGNTDKGNGPISQTTSTQLLAGVPGKRLRVCSVFVVGADAENLSFVEGTGSVCGTSTLAIIGGTTAANGPNFLAGGGATDGIGAGTIAAQALSGNNFCLLQSGSGRVAGNFTYVWAPN